MKNILEQDLEPLRVNIKHIPFNQQLISFPDEQRVMDDIMLRRS